MKWPARCAAHVPNRRCCPIPVICIGGLTAGGAGKTPVALHIGKLIKDRNIPAFFLSRGYGGKLQGPVLVDPTKHTAAEVGDEPLLLAKLLPTVIAKDRLSGARLAIAQGAKAIIMDDGFQNPAIAKTLSLVVIDGQSGFGNGRLLPAGPLRELPQIGLRRGACGHCHQPHAHRAAAAAEQAGAVRQNATGQQRHAAQRQKIDRLLRPGLAPEILRHADRGLGVSPVETIAFPDHYLYTQGRHGKPGAPKPISAGRAGDHRQRRRAPAAGIARQVSVVDITLVFDNAAMLDAILDYALKQNAKT